MEGGREGQRDRESFSTKLQPYPEATLHILPLDSVLLQRSKVRRKLTG